MDSGPVIKPGLFCFLDIANKHLPHIRAASQRQRWLDGREWGRERGEPGG
jgi:hypothetical protein